jgi:hypothetical protein
VNVLDFCCKYRFSFVVFMDRYYCKSISNLKDFFRNQLQINFPGEIFLNVVIVIIFCGKRL